MANKADQSKSWLQDINDRLEQPWMTGMTEAVTGALFGRDYAEAVTGDDDVSAADRLLSAGRSATGRVAGQFLAGGVYSAGKVASDAGYRSELREDINTMGQQANVPAPVTEVASNFGAAFDVFEDAQTILNTGLSTGILVANSAQAALMQGMGNEYAVGVTDSFTVDDVRDIWDKSWEGEVTPGRAIAYTFGRNAMNIGDWVTGGNLQKGVNEWIIEENKKALEDPSNTRGLLSWSSGLHSEFDIFDKYQGDSAFNQGVGRWITGASDAAIMWWAAPDIIVAKGVGFAGRRLLTKSIDSLADVNKAGVELAQHRAAEAGLKIVVVDGVEYKAKRTSIGRLSDSLVDISDEAVAVEHDFARLSSNKTLVARVIAEADTPEKMDLGIRAMIGDSSAVREVREQFSASVADGMSLTAERNARLAEYLRLGNEGASGSAGRAQAIQNQRDEIDRLNKVLEEERARSAELNDLMTPANKGTFSTTGVSAVRFGTANKEATLRLARGNFGFNTPARLAVKANERANRKAGKLFTEKSFTTIGGRTIRVFRAGADYFRTYRAMGRVNIAHNSDDLYDEIASIFTTNPIFRRIQRLAPEERTLRAVNERGQFTTGDAIDVDAVRNYWLGRAVQATTAQERMEVAEGFQSAMLDLLRSEYGLSARKAREIFQKYKNKRKDIDEKVDTYGWFKDGDEIVAVPDLQSRMAETFEIMDFDFIETIFRLEQGRIGAQSVRKKHGLGEDLITGKDDEISQQLRLSYESGVLAKLDALWRPLVLMRLGYTQRNVIEGMLRELAAYGSLGFMTDRDKAIRLDPNMSRMERIGYRANQFTNALTPAFLPGSYKAKVKKLTREIAKQQEELQYLVGDLRAREIAQEKALALRDRISGKAKKQAEKNLARKAKERARSYASATAEDTEDLTLGQVTEMMDNATEITVPASYVQPLYQTKGGRASKSVSGFEDELDAVLQPQAQKQDGRLDSLDEYMGMEEVSYASLSKWLPEESRQRLAQVMYSEPGTPEYEDYLDLLVDASFSAVDHAERRGFAVVRVRGDGRYDVIQSREEIMINDLEQGTIAVLPKENFGGVQSIRARVYGDVLDLRYLLDDAPEGAQYGSVDELMDAFWVDPDEYGLDADTVTELTEYAVDVITSNPDLIRAVNVGRAIIRLKDSHPEIYELAKQKGLLSYSRELKKAIDRARKSSDTAQSRADEWIAERDAFLERMDDPEFLETLPELEDWIVGSGDDITFHGGSIKDDVVTDPAVTEASVSNLHGSAYLYATAAQWMGAEYILVKSFKEGAEAPKLYMVDHPYQRDNFIDMDGLFIDPETGIPNRDVDEDAARWFDEVLRQSEFDDPFEEALDEVHFIMQEMVDRKAFFLGGTPEPMTMKNFREAMQEWITNKQLASPDDVSPPEPTVQDLYEAQELIRNAALEMGAVGLRHKGGKNFPSVVKGETEHDVYVYYVEPEVTPVESLTPEIMRLQSVKAKYVNAEKAAAGRTSVVDFYERFAPYDVRKWDASDMTPRTMDILTDLAHEAGYGSVLVTDALAPSGRRVIARPDQMTVGVDNPDDVIPGKMLEKDYIDRVFPELQHANLLENASVFRGRDVDELTAMIGNREAAEWISAGGKKPSELSTEARASIARAMEASDDLPGYSHVSVGEAEKVYSVSQIMGGKKFGSVYGAMLDGTDVEQETARILKGRSEWSEATELVQETTKELEGLKSQFETQTAALEDLAAKMRKLTFKRTNRKNPNRGFGTEKFAARAGYAEQEIEGPFMDSMYASLASSESRNRMILFGLADVHHRELQRGSQEHLFKPGQEYYFLKVSEQLNSLYRKDPLAEILLNRPELRDDDIFAEALPGIIEELQKTQRGRAWLRDQGGVEEFKGLVDQDILSDAAFDNAYEAADRIRTQLDDILPADDDLWRRIGEGDITSTELMGLAGWRSDWGAIKDYEMILNNERWYRKTIGKAMRTLGTVPEDHLIRHPFFRARWREDMVRQMELLADANRRKDPNWDGFFSQDELNQMSLVSRQYALKATNETLYTIQRISTPAHMMKFISPFFPAWASTMRFWTLRMPFQKPENVIRYGMVFDAPASMGMMQDREGNQLEGSSGTFGMMKKFLSDDENQIVIQTSGKSAEWLSKATGGQTRIGISRGSLDMMLQGDTFWLPGFGPLLTVGIGAFAQWKPDLAEGFKHAAWYDEDLPFRGAVQAVSKAIYDSTLPFGPSKEKSPTDVLVEAFAPGMAANAIKRLRGTDSASFSNSAVSIYRDDINRWELGGRVGPPPEMKDAIGKAQAFYLWRIAFSGTLPFAPQFTSANTFYVNEWRAIEKETYDAGGNYTDAMDEFIGRYGPEYWAYMQSLSGGSSGVSAKVGEYKEVTGNMDLYSKLANIGDDASYMTMASRGVADWSYDPSGFDPAVYAWQFNRSIEGASGKFFRSGSNQRTDMLQDIDKQAGWYYYDKALTPYKLLYENGEVDEKTYRLIKDQIVYEIGRQYPTWFEVYGRNSNERYVQSAEALSLILSDEKWVQQHGQTDYAQALFTFQSWRNQIIQILLQRGATEDGSDSIDAKSNADLAMMYKQMVLEVGQMDPSGEATRTIDRFFGENDALVPVPGVDY